MECILDCDLTSEETDTLNIVKGNPSVSCDENGMIIDSMIFDDSSDRDRVIIDHSTHFHTKRDSEILFEAVMSSKQYYPTIYSSTGVLPNILSSRIRNIREDPRMCCSCFCIKEVNNGLKCMFVMTDDVIYAYYGRDSVEGKGQASFGYLIPLCRRGIPDALSREGPLADFYCLAIGFHQRNGWTVRFYIDGRIYYSIDRIGYRLDPKYCVYERGGTAYQIEVEELELSFTHSSPLDFYLPDNYAREYITTDKSGRYPIFRNGSALIQLKSDSEYMEPFPDLLGEYKSIKPEVTFAVVQSESRANQHYRTFGQGIVTRLQHLEILYRNMDGRFEAIREESSKSEYSEKDQSYSNKLMKQPVKQPPNKGNQKKKMISEESSDSFIFECPNGGKKGQSGRFKAPPPVKKVVNTQNARKKEAEQKSPVGARRGFENPRLEVQQPPDFSSGSEVLESFDRRPDYRPPSRASSDSDSIVFKHERIGESPKRLPNKPDDACRVEGKRSNMTGRVKSSPKVNIDSLETLEETSSLETIGESLKYKSHEYCWQCGTICLSSCCSGKCGSRSCSFSTKRVQQKKYKGVIPVGNEQQNSGVIEFDKPPVGRPIKLSISSKRYQEININE